MYNSSDNQLKRGFKRKKDIVLSIGGKCSVCGYDKNLSALTFHHLDPSTKKFQIDLRRLANCKNGTLLEEVSKCVLVCRNCHAEIENPHFNNWQTTDNIKEQKQMVAGGGIAHPEA